MESLPYPVRILVGTAVLIVYEVAAVIGFLFLRWVVSDPPSLPVVVLAFVLVVIVGGFLGYRNGATRMVASIDARRLPRARAQELHRRLGRLCVRMDVERPPVLVADLGAPNALSIGGARRGAIVLDHRLLSLLTIDEIEGILAHELAHLESYHTLVNTLVLTAVRITVGFVFLFLFPIVLFLAGLDRAAAWVAGHPRQRQYGLAALFQLGVQVLVSLVLSVVTLAFLAHSRRQEYAADRRAVDATGKPAALARALSKIQRATRTGGGVRSLLYIHDERTERRNRWLSTHPPIEQRVQRLLETAGVDPRGRRLQVSRLRP